MKKAEDLYNNMKDNASEKDIHTINSKLGKMCKGALQNVWQNVISLSKMMNDNKVAWGGKAIAIGALLYTVSPVDAIPDIIPLLGLTDDAAIITTAVTFLGTALRKYRAVV